ncbi:MAG: hypothetical protein AAGK00_03515 [Pseudomonadota bacterium]
MSYEYKCVAAPEKARRHKGAKTRTDRVAAAMQELIAEESNGGWEYLRTDLIPVEEKASFFARPREVHRAVLVFRRAKVQAERPRPVAVQEAAAPKVGEDKLVIAGDDQPAGSPAARLDAAER